MLHYYFGTKEALLVEVVRRDAEHRIARLDEPLGAASSADEILQILVADLQDSIDNEPGFWVLGAGLELGDVTWVAEPGLRAPTVRPLMLMAPESEPSGAEKLKASGADWLTVKAPLP